jgi:hypothetical protein
MRLRRPARTEPPVGLMASTRTDKILVGVDVDLLPGHNQQEDR